MNCYYFLVSLKLTQEGTSNVLRKIVGLGRWCIDLIRVPYYEQRGIKNIFCGVENDGYTLIDFESGKARLL